MFPNQKLYQSLVVTIKKVLLLLLRVRLLLLFFQKSKLEVSMNRPPTTGKSLSNCEEQKRRRRKCLYQCNKECQNLVNPIPVPLLPPQVLIQPSTTTLYLQTL